MSKRKKLKAPKRPNYAPETVRFVEPSEGAIGVRETIKLVMPSQGAIERLQAEIAQLQEKVGYLQLQLAGATRRDAELSVENLQLKTMRANMFKALGFEAPQ